MLIHIAIKDIIRDPGHHRHIGDIDLLVASIREVGLLQPVVITSARKLVAGARRIDAHYRLGRKTVLCRIVDNLDEALPHLLAEVTENTCRKPFTPSESVRAAELLLPLAAAAAYRRMDFNPASIMEARFEGYGAAMDKIAAVVGVSLPTLTKAIEIVEAARIEPHKFEYLIRKMDQTGKISPVYAELCRIRNPLGRGETASAKVRLDRNGKPVLTSAANRPLLKALLTTILYQLDNALTN